MSTNSTISDGNKARLQASFAKIAAEVASVRAEDVSRVNLDVPTAVGTALGSLPKIMAHKAQIAEELPKFDLSRLERLEDYAFGLLYAHGAYLVATEPPRSLEDVGAEASKLRAVFLGDAKAQVARGIFDGKRIEEIESGNGYRDLSADLVAFVNLYRQHWAALEGKTGISLRELELAEIMAERLITGIGLREQAIPLRGEAIEQRERAFAVFLRAYGDARRAVTYLRWDQDDIEQIAPSLYVGRGRRRPDEPAAVPPATSTAEEPIVNAATEPKPPAAKLGMPGSSPYTE